MKVRVTEKGLKKIIKESIRSVLNEGSDILYHFTDLTGLMGIVENDEFRLTNNRMAMEGGYVMSLSRTKHGGYGIVMQQLGVDYMLIRLTIDGRKLNQRYKTHPVDDLYMYPDEVLDADPKEREKYKFGQFHWPKSKPGLKSDEYFEYEDRLVSKTPTIPNASSYITRVDMLYVDGINVNDEEMAKFLDKFLRVYAGKIHFYKDEAAFFSQNSAKECPMVVFYKYYWYPLTMLNVKTLPDAKNVMVGIKIGKQIARENGWKGI